MDNSLPVTLSTFNASPEVRSVSFAFSPNEVVTSELFALSPKLVVISDVFAFNANPETRSVALALSPKLEVISEMFAFKARFVIVANELRSWSPVLTPLSVVIPNLVFIEAMVSSPVLILLVFDKTASCVVVNGAWTFAPITKPKLNLASAAVFAPVPPCAIATDVALQIPDVIVPKLFKLLLPCQVLIAVFSTFPNPTFDWLIPFEIFISVIEASAIKGVVIFKDAICLVNILASETPPELIWPST